MDPDFFMDPDLFISYPDLAKIKEQVPRYIVKFFIVLESGQRD